MAFDIEDIPNEFLRLHLKYTEATEPPKVFHAWSAITAIAACMQRHLFLETGIGIIYGNMYVWLVGPPGTRKGHAIKPAIKMMQQATEVRFAPDDTGGQRQGLITAMIEDDIDTSGVDEAAALDIENLGDVEMNVDPVNRHVLFVNATELGSFLGQNNLDLTRFLIKMWDGEDYDYRLRKSRDTLEQPLMTMLAGTTPTDISDLLPPAAIGQGFMSRCILVYAPHKEKVVPLSQAALDNKYVNELEKIYKNVFYNLRGSLTVSTSATKLLDKIYSQEVKLNDTRFIYYTERRHTHLIKLTMALCATRGSMQIETDDVETAQLLLTETEKRMPEALGEFGLSPIAVSQNKMLEYLRYAKEIVSERVLWAVMQRDMKLIDFKNALSALINSDKITAVDTKTGRGYVYKDSITRSLSQLGDDGIDALLNEEQEKDKRLLQ